MTSPTDNAEELPANVRRTQTILKVVVVALGVLFIVAFIALAVTMVEKFGGNGSDTGSGATPIDELVVTPQDRDFVVDLGLPADSQVMSIQQGEHRVLIRVIHADNSQEALSVDVRTGATTRIRLTGPSADMSATP